MTQPKMFSNYGVQIKNEQYFPNMLIIIDLFHYSCCPNICVTKQKHLYKTALLSLFYEEKKLS